MDHKNAIGDLDKIEDLIESDKLDDIQKRKTQPIVSGNIQKIEKNLDENIKTVTMNQKIPTVRYPFLRRQS